MAYSLDPALVAAPALALMIAVDNCGGGWAKMLFECRVKRALNELPPTCSKEPVISKEAETIATSLLRRSLGLCVEPQGMSEWLVEEEILCRGV